MSKKIQTPIEWFISEFQKQIEFRSDSELDLWFKDLFPKAIEKEKQYKQKLADDAFRLGLETGKVFKSIEL